ncbi:MAG: hypothetical protein KAI47_20285, partial [Deltaproteobacteria bacterium]|nr:hypothetical protein [Deltaproteobacteria bacterium]
MNQTLRLLSWTLASSLLATSVNAAPRVPDPLAPWVTWVRDRTPQTRCPFFHGAKERQCRWPTRLKISLEKTGGTFSQTWQLYNAGLVPLPGNAKRWPLDVRADGKVIPVVGHAGRPQVMLTAGHHQITGRFRWDTLPQTLAVPAATGLVSLTVDGVGVPFPRRDAKGMLLLGTKHQSTGEAQRLDVIVHRKIRDEIPLEVTTRIKLDVAGVAREITLPQALLPNFAPLSLTSKLPARLGAKGRLRVQVRPGKWEILLRARQRRRNDKLTLPKPHLSKGDIGTGEEVWVFEPRPKLRLVEISGAAPVDPQQTSLFAPWKRFSTYRVAPGKTLILNERRRGEAGASLDQITLRRTLWLDFDGRGLTISDRLKGHLQRSTRLEALPQTKLGRVTADGRDQFITRHGPRVGVEVPRGPISVVAESRYEADPSLIPAVGWHHDVRSLSATLNLPPGWRLFLASGVDSAPGTWIGRWTLLDMFLVLVLGLAIARLFGWKVGALALIVLVLTFTEPGAPRWIWPFVIVLEALRRVLPRGWLHRILLVPHLSVALALILIGLPFCLQQVRQAIYPTLEHPEHRATNGSVYSQSGGFLSLARQAGESGDKTVRMTPSKPAGSQPQWLKSKQSHRGKRGNIYQSRLQNQQIQQLLDPNAVVQTGPGVPRWGWNTISLTWNGPVRQGEKIGLVLLSPTVNLIVGLLRAALLLALLILLIVIAQRRRPVTAGDGESGGDGDGDGSERAPTKPKPRDTPTPTPRPGQVAALILLGASLWTGNAYAQAPFPPTKLLDELGARLSKPAPCAPRCASISRLRLTLAGDVLRARVEIDAATLTAVPLPGRAQQWRPKTVIVDGTPATGLRRHGGHLWIALTTGRHEVHLAGPIGSATTIQLTLPLRPHRVEVQARAWRVD